MSEAEFESLIVTAKQDPTLEQDAQEVREKYGSMFTSAGIPALDPAKFKAFLTFKENRHWSGINRHSGQLTADLPLLKRALTVLVDEAKPVSTRIDEARGMIDGLGKAVISAILIVRYPEKYGVYNNLSGRGLGKIRKFPGDLEPDFNHLSTGQQYEKVNAVLDGLRKQYGISFWTLDTVLGQLGSGEPTEQPPSVLGGPAPVEGASGANASAARFALEKHLEEFLVDNWDETTSLSDSLDILTDEDGELIGKQYPTDVGPIDILSTRKDGSGYTVIELKRDQTGDQTVGQVARYMGWVKKKLAKDGQVVRGLIICRDADEKLMTALEVVPNVEVFTYEVSFTLSKKD